MGLAPPESHEMAIMTPVKRRWFGLLLSVTLCASPACKGDEEAKKKDEPTAAKASVPVAKERRDEDGLIVRTYDEDNDGVPESTRYYEEIADPDDPADSIRRLRKMEIDVNSDGQLNVVRHYNSNGKLDAEHLDHDLDGVIDVISYYDDGELARKEILEPESQEVEYTRYYSDGSILRIERDTNDDGKIDYWEYYEEGILSRIGRDFNADGRADSWQKR